MGKMVTALGISGMVLFGVGIALGSWWAYYELGWGGWWFWDPVENASFMPWLAGTALLHSLAVSEKRGVFKAWTVMLAIIAFALSLLGTFLVRSGVLTSVHAFASDPARGMFVLGILTVVIGASLLLFALRADRLNSESRYAWLSRESFLLVNNLLLITATTVVLLGTLFPLIADAFNLGKISVGAPYFNALFVPVTLVLLVFLGLGSLTNWKRHQLNAFLPLWKVAVASVALGVALPLFVFGSAPIKVT
jgi:cytochrome c-type biogenesis protein CcmF